MRLTLLSDYSMRVLMYLAINPDRLATVTEISENYGISRNHLTKVVHQLGKADYIKTIRGRAGGIRLAKPADQISIGDIIRLMESPSVLVECFPGGKQQCIISPVCILKQVLTQAETAFYGCLDNFTLADITTNATPLQSLLHSSAT